MSVRVLIVAPDQPGINAVPEVRRIQARHDIALLYGAVTAEDVFRSCQEKPFDVIHFAAHGGPDGVSLSSGTVLSVEDIAQILRLRETRGVFFSSCNAGKLAAYCARHGATWAICSEVELEDDAAWKMAAAFYSHQSNGHAKDFVGAYTLADSGDGDYGLHIAPEYIQELQRAAALATTLPHAGLTLTRAEMLRWAAALLVLSVLLSWLIMRLAGGGG